MFSLLPGIGRSRYRWLYIVVDRTFTSGVQTCTHTYSLIITAQVIFFACLIFVVSLDREIILTVKFS